MSYRHIANLYREQQILLFRECWASEKIHGTSAHVSWKEGKLNFFSGGSKMEQFLKLFNQEELIKKFQELGHDEVVVFGEAYGGNMQGMSHTYGNKLLFVAFEVKIVDTWLDVSNAADVAGKLGLDFVPYRKISTDLVAIDAERDLDSEQAIKNGMGPGHKREGIVLRPLVEMTLSNGERIIVKHKAEAFQETKKPRKVGEDLEVLSKADDVALEWVTDERLRHVLDALACPVAMESTSAVIKGMIEDVKREGEKEIVWSKDVERAIGTRGRVLFHKMAKEIK